MEERLYWIGFNLVKGIGAVRFQSLLDRFGDAKTAWEASPSELAEASLGKKALERFLELRSSLDLEMLSQEPLHVDDIRSQIGLPIEKISAALTMMELKGMVRQVGGMNYISVREENANYLVEEE